jgi:hypothetical protein
MRARTTTASAATRPPTPNGSRASELMPDELFRRLAQRDDHELAEVFMVPLEQVAAKRQNLRLARPGALT